MRGTWARYGNVLLKTTVCPDCKAESIVLDGEISCCGLPADVQADREKIVVAPRFKRNRPSLARQREILEAQGNRCLYCENEFGTLVAVRGVMRRLGVAWDHLVPFSYSANNRDENFAAACGLCNGVKSNRVFETIEDARAFVKREWFRKEYRVL